MTRINADPGIGELKPLEDEDDDANKPTSLWQARGLSPRERIALLTNRMRVALAGHRRLDLSGYPHRIITESLHALAYEAGSEVPLFVSYNDGSSNRDGFTARGLTWTHAASPVDTPKLLRVGTLTFRHLAYDDYVDCYLLRDRETRAMTSAEIERAAYARLTDVLRHPYLSTDAGVLIFHTGLEPLVFGVYRAVSDHLRERQAESKPRLVVRPIYYVGDNEEVTGSVWAS